ncbi:hypothetical protein MLD38_005051 [Melastoma candidum]|uniref:Uncharacterized protein n=1 Tax=Melastoma candidum TaxID=119954 RepID=A0ACB9SG90_9MYRT|nr:hypothetical protein MLD38_005051 [Melastoma candidum]
MIGQDGAYAPLPPSLLRSPGRIQYVRAGLAEARCLDLDRRRLGFGEYTVVLELDRRLTANPPYWTCHVEEILQMMDPCGPGGDDHSRSCLLPFPGRSKRRGWGRTSVILGPFEVLILMEREI